MNLLRRLPRFRQAYREMETFGARERWSRGDIESLQLDRINVVWGHAIAHVPHYRELHAARGLPDRFSSLDEFTSRVPVLSKGTVRADSRRFLSDRAASGGWRSTSGSSGEPLRAFWGNEAHRETLRAKYRFYQMWNIDILDRMAYLWGHGNAYVPGLSGRIHRVRQPIEDRLRNRLRLSAYYLSEADLQRYLVHIERFRPRSLYGYSSALELLARSAARERFHCDSIGLSTLTAETATPEMVQAIESAFGAPAVIEYGSGECGVFAHEWPDRKVHVREDIAMVETRVRDDGQRDIIVSVLTNPSFPLLRYEIGDVTDRPLEQPSHGFATLNTVVGRSNDFVVTKRGARIHYTQFKHVLDHASDVHRFQVHQHASGFVSVHLETSASHDRAALVRMKATFETWLDGFGVEVISAPLQPLPTGKYRWLVSAYRVPDRTSQGVSGAH